MGTWGVGLYSDDDTVDLRGDYVDLLKRGKTNEEALQTVINKDAPKEGSENEPTFWYALADTLWNYGRLTTEVKEKALHFLEPIPEDERWDSPKTWEKRKQVLYKLKEKLLTEQPPEKKVRPYVYYLCPWKLGDVFAYQMHRKPSEEAGLKGKWIVFRKTSEAWAWPGHIVPVVQFYRWIGDEIPPLDEIIQMPVLTVFTSPRVKGLEKYYELNITSKRQLAMQHYQYLGNYQDDQLIERSRDQMDCWMFDGKNVCIFEEVFLLLLMTKKNGKYVFKDDKCQECQGDGSLDNFYTR